MAVCAPGGLDVKNIFTFGTRVAQDGAASGKAWWLMSVRVCTGGGATTWSTIRMASDAVSVYRLDFNVVDESGALFVDCDFAIQLCVGPTIDGTRHDV